MPWRRPGTSFTHEVDKMKQKTPRTGMQKLRLVLTWALVFVLVLALAGGTAAWLGLSYWEDMKAPVAAEGDDYIITIPRGASSSRIGEILEEAGIINSALVFRFHLRFNDLDGKIQAGNYVLSPVMSMEEVIEKLLKGDAVFETVRFTVPEGLFLTDIATRLEDRGLVDAQRFIQLANDLDLWDYWFIDEIPPGLDYPLEGYLFPNTYEVFADVEDMEKEIIRLMLRQFDRVFTQEWRDRAEEMGMTVHEIVTMASIVEKEAVVAHEQAKIAGVFYNRLDRDLWPRRVLESCATVNYVLGTFSRQPTLIELEIDSPYNTYRNPGLPPGPIAAPGRGALEAALYPDREKPYLYFRAKGDGSGEHNFNFTFSQHQRNESGN